jgi:RNA polymerase sigma factor (sigma-70 family)
MTPRRDLNRTAPPVLNDPIYRSAKSAVRRRSAEYADLFTREDLQDLTSEVWIKYHQKWSAGKKPDNLHAWMSAVAAASVIDELRRRTARPKLARLPEGDDAADVVERVLVDLRTPSAITHYSVLLQTALDRLGEVHPEDPRLIKMRHVSGLSNAEIAAVLVLKEETVKKRLQRATERLIGLVVGLSGSGPST